MLHWRYKLTTIALVALALASVLAKGKDIGFHW
jgi:hypothetical protein